jgi:tRNA A37 threonylcarbamoyladenosine modification protein TsaB
MYSLLICAVISPGQYCLYDASGNPKDFGSFDIRGKEFDQFLEILSDILKKNEIEWDAVRAIYSVTGPASFTGGRIVSLTLGAITRVYTHITLAGLTLFAYWEALGNEYPMALEANREEYVIQQDAVSALELKPAKELEASDFATWHSSISILPKWETPVQYKQDFRMAWSVVSKLPHSSTIEPLYLKKPNITLSSPFHGTNGPPHQ